jgi:hypothetical protein
VIPGGGIITVGIGVTNLGAANIDVLLSSFEPVIPGPKAKLLKPVDREKAVGKISTITRIAEIVGGAAAGYSDANGTTATVTDSNGNTSQVNIRNTGNAQAVQERAREERRAAAARKQAEIGSLALRSQTLSKSQGIGGCIWFPNAKASSVIVRIPINGFVYEIPFDGLAK